MINIEPLLRRLNLVWTNITQPTPDIGNVDERQHVQLLINLTVALFLAVIVIAPLWILGNPTYGATVPISIGISATLILVYVLSRSRHYQLGAFVMVALLPGIIAAIIATTEDAMMHERMLTLNYLVVGVLLASILLNLRQMLLIAGFSVLLTAVFFFVPGLPFSFVYSYIVYVGIMSALLIVIAVLRSANMRRLRDSQRRYESLFQQSVDGVFILSTEGLHIGVNQRAADMLGYTTQEMIGMSFRDLVMPSEVAQSQAIRERLLRGERIPPYERRFRKKDGTVLPVEINVELVRDDEGRPLHLQSLVRDISRRKRNEAALQQSEARNRALLSAIPDLMFRLRADGTYLDFQANDSSRLLGNPDQIIGHTVYELLPPEAAESHMEALRRVMETRALVLYGYNLTIRDQDMHFEARMVPSGPDEAITIVRDVTEQMRLQMQTFALAVEKERISLLEKFVQNTSHELRTPLSVIKSNLYLIGLTASQESRLRAYIDQATAQVDQLARLLDMVLKLTRIDSEMVLSPQPCDLGDTVETVVAMFRQASAARRLTIRAEVEDALPRISLDVSWFSEALRQLLDNAQRFTPEGGTILTRVYRQDDQVMIEVSDTGVGIAPEAMPHLFERFWRQDEAHHSPGFGLGLPLALAITEQHGGRLTVESTPGHGSCFRIALPRVAPAPDSGPG